MLDRIYRRRLEGDLSEWQAQGVITADAAAAIRARLPEPLQAITATIVVAIVGGLLVAASFLAFVAANWSDIARPLRVGIILVGLALAHGLAAWFDRNKRGHLADLATGVGAIIFGAGIALIGQMYHLGEDFTGAMLLWAAGSLLASALTGSRGALFVALVTACVWNWMRSSEIADANLAFGLFWLIAALLAVAWNTNVVRHGVAIAAIAASVAWAVFGPATAFRRFDPHVFAFICEVTLLTGGGLLLSKLGPRPLRDFGAVLSNYGTLALGIGLALGLLSNWWGNDRLWDTRLFALAPAWMVLAAIAGILAAIAVAALQRSRALALSALAMTLAFAAAANVDVLVGFGGRWLIYAVALASMLALVISGVLDECRPRVVAGWIGLGGTLLVITWAVKGSLLQRSLFLAAAGAVVIVAAIVLDRLSRKVNVS